MRVELYADNKDLFKWDQVIAHAKTRKQRIVWAAMLRPDKGEHGEDWECPPKVADAVLNFFERERESIEQDPSNRDLWRARQLVESQGLEIEPITTVYGNTESPRRKYIDMLIADYIKPSVRPATLFFLDPDNGMGTTDGGHQVHTDHMHLMEEYLRPGDSLAMIQFMHHEKNWVAARKKAFVDALRVDERDVEADRWCTVAMFIYKK